MCLCVGWLFNVPAAGALRVFMCWLFVCLTSQQQELYVCLFVGWLLTVPLHTESISIPDLLRQVSVLPH